MSDPLTLEEAIMRIASLRHMIVIKSRSITWLENKVVGLERENKALNQTVVGLREENNLLHAQTSVYSAQNDRLSERVFMCENEPSAS